MFSNSASEYIRVKLAFDRGRVHSDSRTYRDTDDVDDRPLPYPCCLQVREREDRMGTSGDLEAVNKWRPGSCEQVPGRRIEQVRGRRNKRRY